MESFSGEKNWATAEVNMADIDPMHLMHTHTHTILLVYPGFVHFVVYNNSNLKTGHRSDG